MHTFPTSVPTLSRSTRVAAAAALTLTLAACAGPADDEADDPAESPGTTTSAPVDPADSDSPSATETPLETPTKAPPAPAGPTLAVTIDGDTVRPNAEELSVEVGEPLLLTFDTDRGGELHVHSKPEQYVEFEAGTSEQELVIETPGTVEIEDHDTGAVVAVVQAG